MPDWSYHPLIRPALFALPPDRARDLTLTLTGKLAAAPLGTQLIRLLGHMHPPPEVGCSALGLDFVSPVGLGAGLDTEAVASAAFAHFGFGFLEVGPVTLNPIQSPDKTQRYLRQWAISYPDVPVNGGSAGLAERLQKHGTLPVPVGIRLGYQPGLDALEAACERETLIQQLAPHASFFVLDCQRELACGLWDKGDWAAHLAILAKAQRDLPTPRPILVNFRVDIDLPTIYERTRIALDHGVCGVVVGGAGTVDGNRRLFGCLTRDLSLQIVKQLHATYGHDLTIIGSGGICQPQDALDFLDAGASLIQVHSGFVYAGPGLPKRINEAVAFYRPLRKTPVQQARPAPLLASSWFWGVLLGLALAVSGLVVWRVAITHTILPYDEDFLGLSRAELIAINPNLLPFMEHDRVTLAGTMMATGIIYIGLSLGGIRRGQRWALHVISISAVTGFLSFFLFLGFGYFDPIHALLTVALLPLWLLSVRAQVAAHVPVTPPNLTNNRRWFKGQWAQMMFVTIGVGLLLGGVAIATVGILYVFVPEDLVFLNTTPEMLNAANSRLLPLIAHDRVGFGGNLISAGVAVLFLSLWGCRQGERWLWWTLALGGTPGFVAGIGIHLSVGYLDVWHLLPALVALLIFVVGLAFAFPYLYYPEHPVSQRSDRHWR